MTVPVSRLAGASRVEPAARPVDRYTSRDTGERRADGLAKALMGLGGVAAEYGRRYLASKQAGEAEDYEDGESAAKQAEARGFASVEEMDASDAGYSSVQEAEVAGWKPKLGSKKRQEGIVDATVNMRALDAQVRHQQFVASTLKFAQSAEEIDQLSGNFWNEELAKLPAEIRNDPKRLKQFTDKAFASLYNDRKAALASVSERMQKQEEEALGWETYLSVEAMLPQDDQVAFSNDPDSSAYHQPEHRAKQRLLAYKLAGLKATYIGRGMSPSAAQLAVYEAVEELAIERGDPGLLFAASLWRTGSGTETLEGYEAGKGSTLGSLPYFDQRIRAAELKAASQREALAEKARLSEKDKYDAVIDRMDADFVTWQDSFPNADPTAFPTKDYEEELRNINPGLLLNFRKYVTSYANRDTPDSREAYASLLDAVERGDYGTLAQLTKRFPRNMGARLRSELTRRWKELNPSTRTSGRGAPKPGTAADYLATLLALPGDAKIKKGYATLFQQETAGLQPGDPKIKATYDKYARKIAGTTTDEPTM